MEAFRSTDELNAVMQKLWHQIKSDPNMSGQLLSSKLVVRFVYKDPVGQLTIDARDGKEMKIYTGEIDIKPDVEMAMKADTANEFWLGRLNLPVAMMSGKIVSRGPVNKVLSLLPVVKPAFKLYPEVLSSVKDEAA